MLDLMHQVNRPRFSLRRLGIRVVAGANSPLSSSHHDRSSPRSARHLRCGGGPPVQQKAARCSGQQQTYPRQVSFCLLDDIG
jgi:hypothetical protein